MGLNEHIKKFTLGMDARSTRGVMSRGKPVYRYGSNSPVPLDLRKKAAKKLGQRK